MPGDRLLLTEATLQASAGSKRAPFFLDTPTPRLKQQEKGALGEILRKASTFRDLSTVIYTPHPSPNSSNSPTPGRASCTQGPQGDGHPVKSHTVDAKSQPHPLFTLPSLRPFEDARPGAPRPAHAPKAPANARDGACPQTSGAELRGTWPERAGKSSIGGGLPSAQSTPEHLLPPSTAAWKSPQAPFAMRDEGLAAVRRMVLVHRHLAPGPLPPPPRPSNGKGAGPAKQGAGP